MRRILAGVVTLTASVALPATFEGTGFLVALWVILGLGGALLIVTSAPVKEVWIGELRRELGIDGMQQQPAPNPQEAQDTDPRPALHALIDELTTIRIRIADAERTGFYIFGFELPAAEWSTHRHLLAGQASLETRRVVGDAYARVDQLNRIAEARENNGSRTHPDDALEQSGRLVRQAIGVLEAELED